MPKKPVPVGELKEKAAKKADEQDPDVGLGRVSRPSDDDKSDE